MHIAYFPDTDTIDFDFRTERGSVFETVDGPTSDIMLDFDQDGRLIGLTIEHASQTTDLESLRQQPQFEEIAPNVSA